MHALVLEDELILATLWQDVLETAGLQVTVVTSLAEAEQALSESTFDIHILDYKIHRDTCAPLVETIRGKSNDSPILIITGADTLSVLEEAPILKTADHLLQKPVDAHRLRELICDLLGITAD